MLANVKPIKKMDKVNNGSKKIKLAKVKLLSSFPGGFSHPDMQAIDYCKTLLQDYY